MIGIRVVTLVFEEPSLTAEVPGCLDVVAAALMVGYPLLPPPNVSHEDVTIGYDRLLRFADLRASEVRREIRWHFCATMLTVEGVRGTVQSFRARWDQDPALRRHLGGLPQFPEWRAALTAELLKNGRRTVLARDHNRVAYGQMRGDPDKLAAMESFLENGGIRG